MIQFNDKTYARNDAEFVASLFQAGNTCNGYYKRTANGIRLYTMQKQLAAFIVINRYNERFVVTASMFNGRPRYMYSTCTHTEQWLGIENMGLAQIDQAIRSIDAPPAPGGAPAAHRVAA